MKRILAIISIGILLATAGFGLTSVPALGGVTHALADDSPNGIDGNNGVGPSATGLTGNARACEAHSENHGASKAKGLDCGEPSSSFSISIAPSSLVAGSCDVTFTGTGLMPGANIVYDYVDFNPNRTGIIYTFNGSNYIPIQVAPDGTLNAVGQAFANGYNISFTTTDAAGNVLVVGPVLVAC
jgi:hypothetical protein